MGVLWESARPFAVVLLAVACVALLWRRRRPMVAFAFATAGAVLAVSSGAGVGGAAMAVAFLVVSPVGIRDALPVLGAPLLLLAAMAVGICSSVIPYICDQLAMARLPRASFALMLSLLPATATLIGILVLGQIPSRLDTFGIALVVAGVAFHKPAPE